MAIINVVNYEDRVVYFYVIIKHMVRLVLGLIIAKKEHYVGSVMDIHYRDLGIENLTDAEIFLYTDSNFSDNFSLVIMFNRKINSIKGWPRKLFKKIDGVLQKK